MEKLKERVNTFNKLNEKEDFFELMKTPQPDLIDDEMFNQNETITSNNNKNENQNKNEGAFKLYTTSLEDESLILAENELVEKSKEKVAKSSINTTKVVPNRMSPFVSIDKPKAPTIKTTNSIKKLPSNIQPNLMRGPTRKYRSGSTTSLNINSKNKNQDNDKNKLNSKQNTEIIRPATHNEITYSLESDESTMIDNLISDPDRLKEKLKQGKMDREQLNQLQENYLRLLEQYAEAENFIDTFRLGGQFTGNVANVATVIYFYFIIIFFVVFKPKSVVLKSFR